MTDTPQWADITWRDDLAARVYRPPADAPATGGAALVDVHGGAWASQDRTLNEPYNLAVAAAGFTVVAIDFRDGRVAPHPAASDDVAAAVVWARDNAATLGIDAGRVGLTGSSSGGHLAWYAALTAVEVPFVGAFWPPVDPLGRYRYAESMVGQPVPEGQSFSAKALLRATTAYFPDDAAMGAASISTVVRSGRAALLPPVWLVEAGDDMNVPTALLDDVEAAYRDVGGVLERTCYAGAHHGFGREDSPAARQFQSDLITRLRAALC